VALAGPGPGSGGAPNTGGAGGASNSGWSWRRVETAVGLGGTAGSEIADATRRSQDFRRCNSERCCQPTDAGACGSIGNRLPNKHVQRNSRVCRSDIWAARAPRNTPCAAAIVAMDCRATRRSASILSATWGFCLTQAEMNCFCNKVGGRAARVRSLGATPSHARRGQATVTTPTGVRAFPSRSGTPRLQPRPRKDHAGSRRGIGLGDAGYHDRPTGTTSIPSGSRRRNRGRSTRTRAARSLQRAPPILQGLAGGRWQTLQLAIDVVHCGRVERSASRIAVAAQTEKTDEPPASTRLRASTSANTNHGAHGMKKHRPAPRKTRVPTGTGTRVVSL